MHLPSIDSGLILFLVIGAVSLLFFISIETDFQYVLAQLYGFAHFFFFAFVAYLLSKRFASAKKTLRWQFSFIILAIFCLGGAIELIQPYFDRSANWQDLLINLLGGLFGFLFLGPARHTLRASYLIGAQSLILIMTVVAFHQPVFTLWDLWQATRQFPILSDFETRREADRWSHGYFDKGFARHGSGSLKVVLGTERYAGTTLRRSLGNWNGYATLAFSLYNPNDQPLHITVSIRDQDHFRRGGQFHDRYNQTFTMKQGWNDIEIPVANIRYAPSNRRLELDRLSELVIFTVELPEPRQINLDHVRLIR